MKNLKKYSLKPDILFRHNWKFQIITQNAEFIKRFIFQKCHQVRRADGYVISVKIPEIHQKLVK